MPKLILFPGSEDETVLDLDGRDQVALGRSPTSDVVVKRRMASRSHAVIERRNGRYHLRDTDSFNGTFVNNREVRESVLSHGDEIRIANRILRFEDRVPAAATNETVRVPRPPGIDHEVATARTPVPAALQLEADAAAEDPHLYAVTAADAGLFAEAPGYTDITIDLKPSAATAALLAIADAVPEAPPGSPAPAAAAPPAGSPAAGQAVVTTPIPARPMAPQPRASAPAETVGRGDLAPRSPAPDTSPASPRRAWLLPVLLLVAAAAALFALRGRSVPAPLPSPKSEDVRAFEQALASGEAQPLWDFLRKHENSAKREDAYLALFSRAEEAVVCSAVTGNVRDSRTLLNEGSPLHQRCIGK